MEVRREPKDVEAWSSGGSLQACRRGGMEVWSAGVAMEARAGVATWRHRASRNMRPVSMTTDCRDGFGCGVVFALWNAHIHRSIGSKCAYSGLVYLRRR